MHNFQNVQKKGWVKAGFYINGQIAAVDLNFAVIVIFFVQGYIGPFQLFALPFFPVHPGGPTAILGVFNAF